MRVYLDQAQEQMLVAKCRVRAIIWNWTCDVFDRNRARAASEDAHGLAIKCTRTQGTPRNLLASVHHGRHLTTARRSQWDASGPSGTIAGIVRQRRSSGCPKMGLAIMLERIAEPAGR